MNFKFWTVDAFAQKPFTGNPAAVFIVTEFPADEIMQNIAMEMNLSESVFAKPLGAKNFHIRWFTPVSEVKLCGHATLATGHVLRQEKLINETSGVSLESLSGPLRLLYSNSGITLDFPLQATEPSAPPSGLIESLGIIPIAVHRAHDDWLVECHDETELRSLKPNFEYLSQVKCCGVIVTCLSAAGSPYDFISRFFAPREGIHEDPVTGSAHCKLAPYWREKIGKKQFAAFQASRRGGVLKLEIRDDRVLITGTAITVARGEMDVGN